MGLRTIVMIATGFCLSQAISATYDCDTQLWRPPAPIPHPKPLGTIALLGTLAKNPLEAWNITHFEQPFVTAKFAGIQATVVNSPNAVRRVLMDNRNNYEKDKLQKRIMTRSLSNGLLMSDGEPWRTQRKTLAPIFNHRTVSSFAPEMRAAAQRLSDKWKQSPEGSQHDVAVDITRLTLDVLEHTIFSDGLGRDSEEIREAMRDYFDTIGKIDPFDLFDLPDYIPRLTRLRVTGTLKVFDQAVDKIIEQRRQRLQDNPASVPDDILSHLLKAQDPDTGYAMSEAEVRSNIITFIAAGHESTANTIMWTLYTLSQSPYWSAQVLAEAQREFSGPEEGLVSRLNVTRAVIEETIRLYPPIAAISRAAIEADELEDCRISAGSTVVISPYVLQRHRTLWSNPDAFDPTRFFESSQTKIDRFSYLPFGGGPRVCIGQPFAMQSATLVVATLIKNHILKLAPGHVVWPVLKVTLRPEGGLPMEIRTRR